MKSYAQFGEDEKLVAFLGDKSSGFYIDVGAWDPNIESVTRHFYEKGWYGINIEPLPEYFRMLVSDRIGDINLNCAVSDTGGGQLRTLTRVASQEGAAIAGTGLSTFDQENAASAVTRAGFTLNPIEVPVYTLAEICAEHVPAGTEIDFLKIDVEGWEEQVIRGADWDRWRPDILCIEATRPSSVVPAWDWEPLLFAAGYEFLLFDRLNRFYRDARR